MARGSVMRAVVGAAFVVVFLLLSSGPSGAPHRGASGSSGGTGGADIAPALPPALPTQPGGVIELAPAFSPRSGVVAIGPVPSSRLLTVALGLAPSDRAGLAGLVSALYTPGAPQYRAFLTPVELARAFGATMAAVDAARAYFEGFGLVATASPDHLLLSVSGPSLQVSAAFGTSFEEYRAPDGRTFFSHPTPATLPAVAPWSGAFGLGDVRPIVPAAQGGSTAPTPLTPALGCLGTGGPLLPCQLWQAYDSSSLIGSGTNGSGIRVAVVDPYSSGEPQPQLTSDLASFAAASGFPVGAVSFAYPVPPPGNLNTSANPNWALEDALDLQWSRASAPGATLQMTFSPDAGPGLYDAVDWLVAHQSVDVISLSWGEPDVGVYNSFNMPCSAACNASADGSYGILAPVLAFAAAEGIGVFAASGDCGAADGTSGVSTNFPASDPFVTGVGGTQLTVDASGNYQSEVAWSGNATGARSPGCTNQGGSGGGYAPFPRPWWQSGPPPGSLNRGVPDVALDAATPAMIVFNGGATAVAGTSLSTPFWAGVAAIADQSAGSRLGLLNPSLYAIASGANYSRDFHDIVSGSNGYSAGTGWDAVTGLGSPKVASLVVDLAKRPVITSSNLASFLYATPRFGAAPLAVSFRVNGTGGSGTYPLEGVSFGDGNASFAPGGAATYTFSKPGVYTARSYVSDSIGNYSVSPPLAIVVGGGRALTVTLSASTQTPAKGAPVHFSVGVAGGVGPYTFQFTFGDGTFLYGAPSPGTNHSYGARGAFCAAVVVSDSALPINGGASSRVAVGVGGVPQPNCRNDTQPLTMSPTPGVGVRDAPADFPNLFSVSGGSTSAGTLPPSVQFSTSDPYLGACACAIFRSPGTYSVTGYGNDSENQQTTSLTSVTVAPPLVANFSASPTIGPAPLTVVFGATASGGYGTNVSRTTWTFGNGSGAVGASASATYNVPGHYVALGHLSDLGHGNSSEAFLIDVAPAAGSPRPFLTATVRPAADVPMGAQVNFTGRTYTATGLPSSSAFQWTVGSASGAYRSSLDWTFSVPFPGSGNRTLSVTLAATDLVTGVVTRDPFDLLNFAALESGGFVPKVDALTFSDVSGPTVGSAVLNWTGRATTSGPGATTVRWELGDGSAISGTIVRHAYPVGRYTVGVNVTNTWGDAARDDHLVAATSRIGFEVVVSSPAGGNPLGVAFRANASGGVGPPYTYAWAFQDGFNATAASGTHAFAMPGTYALRLNVSDLVGDFSVSNFTVTVGPASGTFPAIGLLLAGAGAGGVVALAVMLDRRRGRSGGPNL